MPKRLLFVTLVATLLGALPMAGQAQLAPRNPRPAQSANSMPSYNGQGGYDAAPGYGAPAALSYGSPGGYMEPSTAAAAADPSRKLQPGDQLSFKIEEDRDPSTVLVVSQSGDVIVEPLPQAVRVTNLTVTGAAAEIKRLLERDYYHRASVRLNLEKAGVTPIGMVTLSGAVNRVGPVPLWADRPMTVSNAILTAGGFGKFADDRKVKVTRSGRGGTSAETIIVDVKDIITKGRPELDPQVQDGDRIFVPERWIR
jgi:protein involved in polysaccharide export with SLBB domain